MQLIIAGSRTISDPAVLLDALDRFGIETAMVSEVISGCEPNGADRLGEDWAREHGIPVKEFPADWKKLGLRAGIIRNGYMARYACVKNGMLLCLWDGKSRGTKNMIDEARSCMVPTMIFYVGKSNDGRPLMEVLRDEIGRQPPEVLGYRPGTTPDLE